MNMPTECPVCKDGKKYTNKGVKTHIGKKANNGDEAHKKYRESHKLHDSEETFPDPLDQLEFDLQKNWNKAKVVSDDSKEGMSQLDTLYKETMGQMPESTPKPLEETPQSSNPEPPKKILVRKLKIGQRKHWYQRPRRPKVPTEAQSKKVKDPEGLLGLITAIPAVTVVLLILYKLVTDYRFFIDWTKSDIAQLYFWVLIHPSQAVSILILSATSLVIALTIFLMHRLVWRFCFKDLQIRYLKKDETTGELRAVGSSRIGRVYLVIGRGVWDRLYRRLAKKPVPDTVTIYFKRRGFVNPFKVLDSCEKGYLKDPEHSMFVNDGLFKRTLIATRLRRDTENHSTVYWFEGGDYKTIDFDSEWYENAHREEIKTGLSMVGKACGMDSSIQKEQMKTSISFMPTDLIAEQKRVWELKKAKMQKVPAELSR